MKEEKEVFWSGSAQRCDFCKNELTAEFLDGRTHIGSWAIMCPSCAVKHGVGIGQGRGQVYQKQPDGRWKKVRG